MSTEIFVGISLSIINRSGRKATTVNEIYPIRIFRSISHSGIESFIDDQTEAALNNVYASLRFAFQMDRNSSIENNTFWQKGLLSERGSRKPRSFVERDAFEENRGYCATAHVFGGVLWHAFCCCGLSSTIAWLNNRLPEQDQRDVE